MGFQKAVTSYLWKPIVNLFHFKLRQSLFLGHDFASCTVVNGDPQNEITDSSYFVRTILGT